MATTIPSEALPLVVIGFFPLIAVLVLLAVIFLGKSSLCKKYINHKKAKWTTNLRRYENISQAKKSIALDQLKITAVYIFYCYLIVQLLTYRYGTISHGDNKPYLMSLVFVGLPYVALFIHLAIKLNHHRVSVDKSNIDRANFEKFSFSLTLVSAFLALYSTLKIVDFSNNKALFNIFHLVSI